MSRETRTVRPFAGLERLSHSLDGVGLFFGNAACTPDSSIIVDLSPHEYLLRPVTIQWAPDDAALAAFKENLTKATDEAELDPTDISVVLIASTPFLRIADQVFTLSLASIDKLGRSTVLTDPTRSNVFSTPYSGFSIDVYVLLINDIEPRPLRPSAKGTWLAHISFQIDTNLGPGVLPPTPLTTEIKEQHRLPVNVIRYLHFGDHDPLEPYLEQEQPTFYVDEDVLSQLNARRSSPASRALQVQLALDFVATVVRKASMQSEKLAGFSYDDLRTTLLGRVIRVAAAPGATDQDRERMVDYLRTDPELVISFAEHAIGIRAAYLGSLKSGDS